MRPRPSVPEIQISHFHLKSYIDYYRKRKLKRKFLENVLLQFSKNFTVRSGQQVLSKETCKTRC